MSATKSRPRRESGTKAPARPGKPAPARSGGRAGKPAPARTSAAGGRAAAPRTRSRRGDEEPRVAAPRTRARGDEVEARPKRARPSAFGRGAPARSAEPDEPEAPRQRRALSHVGGPVERLEGPPELTELIARALSPTPDAGVRDHVHGFHSYPARLHPRTAAALIEGLSPRGGVIADPFCGSGTVLVEARRLGRHALGVDLNPLAVQLALAKTQPPPEEQRQALWLAAERVAEHAEERRAAKAGPTRPYSNAELREFEIHVLLELDGLAEGISKESELRLRRTLLLVLSSLFGKLTRPDPNRIDPEAPPQKRLASGFAIRFFLDRTHELCRQWEEYEALLPSPPPRVQCIEADARDFVSKLERFGSRRRAERRAGEHAGSLGVTQRVDAFVMSPPYPGVLDYADYHASRLRWLGLPSGTFEQREIGSRRSLSALGFEQAAARWEADFLRVLLELRKIAAPHARLAFVAADSMLAGQPYFADRMLERCAGRAGLTLLGRGSQRRPHFHRQSAQAFGYRPRYEHLLILGAS